MAHACGHDVHTTALLGAGLALAEVHAAGLLPGPRAPALPAGRGGHARRRLAADGRSAPSTTSAASSASTATRPSTSAGSGLREGPITGAADSLEIRLTGSGGHTSRPHLTEDLTFALGKIVTELPAVLSRRLDPRAGVSVVWGRRRRRAAPPT